MEKKIRVLVFLMSIWFALLIGCAETPVAQMSPVKDGDKMQILTPLPKNIKIIPPSADIPKEIAAFSGMWQGAWNETLPVVLVVEEITLTDIRGIYAVGAFKKGQEVVKGGWVYFEGKMNSGKLGFR